MIELLDSGPQDSYYNLLVQGFRAGQLNVKREVPPELARFSNSHHPAVRNLLWFGRHPVMDLSYYQGKLYLYFGITPALLLFWPYAALTGHYLLHKDAVVFFFSAGFLAGAGLLWAIWRRYFRETGVGVMAAGVIAFGLANFAPAILARCDVYEVAISCGYALTMLALVGIWGAVHDAWHRWRWLVAASLAYGLAVGARPSLLFGAVILLLPVLQAWREKRRVWPLLPAVSGPILLIGLGLMLYNALRFDDPLEFGQSYQLPSITIQQFSLYYFWFNFQICFLEPALWNDHFPFVHERALPALPRGYFDADHPFGVLTNIPLVWLALAVPLAWRSRPALAHSPLCWFLMAVGLLFGSSTMVLCLHSSMLIRYRVEYASPLLLLAVVGVFALESALAQRPLWLWLARCGWGLLLIFSVSFNLLARLDLQEEVYANIGAVLFQKGQVDEAIREYQKALEINPNDGRTHNNLGVALDDERRIPEAIDQYQQALRLNLDGAETRNNLGNALNQEGRTPEAISQFEQALRFKPDDAEFHDHLANALRQAGRMEEAMGQYELAFQIDPNYAAAHSDMGNVLVGLGRIPEAIEQYQQALGMRPDDAEIQNNLGVAFLRQGRLAEAILQFQEALRLKPDFTAARNNLAESQAMMRQKAGQK